MEITDTLGLNLISGVGSLTAELNSVSVCLAGVLLFGSEEFFLNGEGIPQENL